MKTLRRFFSKQHLLIYTATCFLIGGLFFLWIASFELPDLRGVSERKVAQSTKIYDRSGEVLLYDLSSNITRTDITIENISPFVKQATVAIEDSNFYNHRGVEPVAFMRAVLVNIFNLSFSQGGSTITQQVIKNTILTKDKTPARKLKEWVLAIKLEQVRTKDQILELYLNENPYGGSIYGVEEASRTFFGKSAKDVTLAEAAYLAALPQAPTYYSPYGNHREQLDARKNLVLERMQKLGFIDETTQKQASEETVTFLPQRANKILAPHFVFYVQEILEKEYGTRVLEEGGLKVITSLDIDLQTKGELITKERALANEKDFNASNAAIVAIDPQNGDVLTMVGSRNYFDTEIPGSYNIALANRQPGSSFKPFVYAAAFTKGFTPETILFDTETQFSTTCRADDFTSDYPCYSPENYDLKFRGPVTLRDALAQSLNIPAVKLLYLVSINSALELAKAMGISTLLGPDRYGLTLVLGGGEVRLLDMVSAYGTFATNGTHFSPRPILSIEDSSGNTLRTFEPQGVQVLSETVAMQINDILSDNVARTPEFGSNSALYFPGHDVAAKTGTTNDYRDAWIIGYTPNIVVGSWAGNNDNSPMEKKIAGFIIAPLWHEFVVEALAKEPQAYFTRSDRDTSELPPMLRGIWQGGIIETIDLRTKTAATAVTPSEFLGERFTGGVHSILYWIDKNNPTGGRPENPENDPQFRLWEYSVRLWASDNGFSDSFEFIVPKSK